MFAASSSTQSIIFSARTRVSIPRAATRPSVEKSASGPTPSLASTVSTSSLTRLCPEAYATSWRASGPTSMVLPSYRGDLSQLYLEAVSSRS